MMKSFEESDVLFPNSESEYGSEFKTHSLLLYSDYVKSAEKISERRAQANAFFLSLNSVIVTAIAVLNQKELPSAEIENWIYSFLIDDSSFILVIVGMVSSIVWYMLLRSYKKLNQAKNSIIHKIEKILPLACYEAEWKNLLSNKSSRKYLGLTSFELLVPSIFAGFYILILILNICAHAT